MLASNKTNLWDLVFLQDIQPIEYILDDLRLETLVMLKVYGLTYITLNGPKHQDIIKIKGDPIIILISPKIKLQKNKKIYTEI